MAETSCEVDITMLLEAVVLSSVMTSRVEPLEAKPVEEKFGRFGRALLSTVPPLEMDVVVAVRLIRVRPETTFKHVGKQGSHSR